jgi:transglutaminase-like putative cysteine protease
MRVDERVDFQPYGAAFAALLSATLLTRCTAASDTRGALFDAACWACALLACWWVRAPLRASRWPTITVQWAGEAVAALGMLLFLGTLLTQGVMPALGAILLALTGAALVIAERRAHLLLLVATCLTQVLMAAAQSRSGWFAPCAAAFTLAVLSLFAFDLRTTLRDMAAATPVDAPRTGHGAAVATAVVMLIALPLYLYVPQPPALALGGYVPHSAHDYGDPREPSREGEPQHASSHASTDDTRVAGEHPEPRSARATPSPAAQDGAQARNDDTAASTDDISISGVQRSAGIANTIVMYVKTSQPVYLRRKVLDRFTGDRWQRTGIAPVALTLSQGAVRRSPASHGNVTIAQQIDVVADLGEAGVPTSAGVTQLRFPAAQLYDNTDGTFAALQPLRADTSYAVDAAPRLFGSRYAEAEPPPDARHLQLDPALSPRVRELANSVTADAGDALHKALALEAHLRGAYAYSYETIVPYQGRTPLEWFLFDSRKGHCEFFASAMVVLLREIGIPARLAQGYSLGERNPLTGFNEVRALDGHAWAEGWIDGIGWVMFEPTPFYPLPHDGDKAPQQVASATDGYLQRMAQTSAQLSPQSLRTALLQTARDSWSLWRHLQRQVMRWAVQALPWIPPAALFGTVAWGAFVLGLLAWRDARERARVVHLLAAARGANGIDTAAHLAQAIELALASRGWARAPQRTWREYCAQLPTHVLHLPERFVDDYDAARYGGEASAIVEHADRVAAMLHARIAAQRYPRTAQRWNRWLAAWRRFTMKSA